MFTFNHALLLESRPCHSTLRRTEWEEIEHFDGPLLANESTPAAGLLERLGRGLERLEDLGNSFRSTKGASLLARESYKKAS